MVPDESKTTALSPEAVQLHRTDQRYLTLRTLFRCGLGAFVAWTALKAVEALAGQSTSVAMTLIFSVLFEFKLAIAITLAGCCAIWALLERSLRRKKVASLQGRIRSLESGIDPNRTSSGLTPGGKTNPLDRRS